jgi:thiamine transporter
METRKLTEIAILIALAAVLEVIALLIPILRMPYGGSVSLGMLPIIIIAFRHGVKEGLIAGFIFGVINYMLGLNGATVHWVSLIFDYSLAFTVLGFAGIFKKTAWTSNISFVLGIFLGGFLRYIVHSIAGVIFWSEYAGDFNPYFYSFIVYNLPYMAGSILLCIIVGLILKRRVPNFKSA